jgi:transposase-like protein
MEDMTNSKKHYSPERKANLAIQAIRGEDKINQLASLNQIHPNQIKRWKKTIEDNASLLFSDKRRSENKSQESLIEDLYKIIGQRDIELDWLKKKLSIFDDRR